VTLFCRVFRRREGEAGLSWEQWLALCDTWRVLFHHAHELGKDTPDRPDINTRAIVFLEQDDLRSSIPSGLHMSCQLSLHISASILSFDQLRSHLLLLFYTHCRVHLLILCQHRLWLIHRHTTTTSQCQLNVFLLIDLRKYHRSTRNA